MGGERLQGKVRSGKRRNDKIMLEKRWGSQLSYSARGVSRRVKTQKDRGGQRQVRKRPLPAQGTPPDWPLAVLGSPTPNSESTARLSSQTWGPEILGVMDWQFTGIKE